MKTNVEVLRAFAKIVALYKPKENVRVIHQNTGIKSIWPQAQPPSGIVADHYPCKLRLEMGEEGHNGIQIRNTISNDKSIVRSSLDQEITP
jgi:hypothetical protein